MTPTENAYVAGIIDGEGCIEFKWADRTRRDRKGHPTYRTLICRLEVPQVDKRLIDWLMDITKEGTRDIKRIPIIQSGTINIVGALVIMAFTECSSRSTPI